MEKVIGPNISVSTSGFYLTGYSTDTLSGTAGYCYNTSTSVPSKNSYTSVNGVTSRYTASQYHVTSSGTYRFHAIDTAGNHNYGSTSNITYYTYHCNYCGQNTNSLHYRCPTHFEGQSCVLSAEICKAYYSSICGKTISQLTNNGGPYTAKYCFICGKLSTSTSLCRQVNVYSYTLSCPAGHQYEVGSASYQDSSGVWHGGEPQWYWHESHGVPPKCQINTSGYCQLSKTTNKTDN